MMNTKTPLRFPLLALMSVLLLGSGSATPNVGDKAPRFRLSAYSGGGEIRFDLAQQLKSRNILLFFGDHDRDCSYCKGLYKYMNQEVSPWTAARGTLTVLMIAGGAGDATQLALRHKVGGLTIIGDRSGRTTKKYGMDREEGDELKARLGVMLINRKRDITYLFTAKEENGRLPWKQIYAAVHAAR